jgi:multidrug resistance efflux pump
VYVAAAAAARVTARRRLAGGATGTHVTENEVDQLVTQARGDVQTALAKRDAARAAFDSAIRESGAEISAAQAQLEAARMRLTRLRNGSRPQEIAAARADVQAVEAQLARAASEADRMRNLAGQGAVSEQALVAATSEQQRLQAEVAHSRQQLALLEAGTRGEEIQEAEAQQHAAEAQLHLAECSRQRVDQRRSELAAAQALVDQSQSALKVARASHVRVSRSRQDADSLAGDVRLATAQLALAREHLSQAVLLSPINGQVIHRHVQPGDSVTADQRILLEVIDPSSLHVEISVSEAELAGLHVGTPVWVALPALSSKQLPGRIESLGEAPRGTAPGYVGRVRLAHLPPAARAGMLANVYRK